MENRVGNELPTEAEIDEAVRAVQKVIDKTERYLISLRKDERMAALKTRTGYEGVVPRIASLVKHHAVSLPGVSVEGMLADLSLAQRLEPLARIAETLLQRTDDTRLQAASECWHAATAYYTSLARVAIGNPEIQRELSPIVDFFAIGKRKPKTP